MHTPHDLLAQETILHMDTSGLYVEIIDQVAWWDELDLTRAGRRNGHLLSQLPDATCPPEDL
jgi:hypothetical protein